MARFVRMALALALTIGLPLAAADAKAVQRLVKQLKDKDSSVRAEAAWDLGQIGATDAVPALAQALGDSSSAVRANAAASLWKLGTASKPAVPELMTALGDSSPLVVGNAAGALRKLGAAQEQTLGAYRRLLRGRDCEARVVGVKGLLEDAPAIDLFEPAWECAEAPGLEADTARDAREALRHVVERPNKVLIPRILDTLKTMRMRDGSALVSAIASVQPPVVDAVPILAGLVDAQNQATQKSAVIGLGRMGAVSLPALPRLVECLQSKRDPEIRENAAESIGRIGPKAVSAVPVLIKAAQDDKWPKVRKASLTALGEMGPAAKEGVPVLRAALKDPDSWISLAARNALFRVEPTKREEVADISDKSRPVQKGSLYDDLSQLSATLPAKVPEAFELNIYTDFAMVTAPYADSKSGRGKFTYRAGTVTGPEEGSGDCKKKILLAKVDFSIVPKVVKQAPGLLGKPSGKVSHVGLSGGVFCKSFGWQVFVEDAGLVEFKIDGSVEKVRKM